MHKDIAGNIILTSVASKKLTECKMNAIQSRYSFLNIQLLCISCNIGRRDLPDMYTQSARATGPRAEGIHIRQIPTAHVTSDMYHFRYSKNQN